MGQSYTSLHYHVIFGAKDRRPLITPAIRTRLYDYIGGIITNENGCLLAAGGTPNHAHLLISAHPQTSVAEMMRLVKANSSKWLHATFPDQAGFAWQTGYGAFTVSHSTLEQVKRYIANQETHHQRVSFEEEFTAFLQRHGITYDERYLWT